MPYTPGNFSIPHVQIQWGGKLPGGEEWSCSLRCAAQVTGDVIAPVPPQFEIAQWTAGSLKNAVLAFHTRPTSRIAPFVRLSFVKANRIGEDGLYMDQTTNEYVFADVPAAGLGNASLPNQCTIAVSTTTGFSRGPAHRGRFYLPTPSVTLDPNTGLVPEGEVDVLRGSVKTFLEDIADVPLIDSPVSLTPMVMSRKAGAAAHRKITGVEIGRVIDTQRRRRKSLVENYRGIDLDLGDF